MMENKINWIEIEIEIELNWNWKLFINCERLLKVLATIPYFNFHFFPYLLIFLQFWDPLYVLNLSTKAVLQ